MPGVTNGELKLDLYLLWRREGVGEKPGEKVIPAEIFRVIFGQ
jgi:hypothetical protein